MQVKGFPPIAAIAKSSKLNTRLVHLSRTDMEYLYYLANASLVLRSVEYLHLQPQLPIGFVTVIHQIHGWVVKVKMNVTLNAQLDGDFKAFMNELGIQYEPPVRVNMALESLSAGQSPTDVMHTYHVIVVSHGSPGRDEIEAFRQQFITGLGYCPPTLA